MATNDEKKKNKWGKRKKKRNKEWNNHGKNEWKYKAVIQTGERKETWSNGEK